MELMEEKEQKNYFVLDQGNSRLKIAIFDIDKNLVFSEVISKKNIQKLDKLANKYQPKATIFSSSGKINQEILAFVEELPQHIKLTYKTKLPIKINYKTPKTLGVDRVANACAATRIYPGKPTLIVDFGTCITYNFITADKQYLGGAISPGVALRAKAMNTFTENLPLVTFHPTNSFIGTDTESCLNVGVVVGVRHEVEGFINQYHEKYPNLTIIFTGGDHSYFVNTIESPIFADLNLTAIGLNEILRHNIT